MTVPELFNEIRLELSEKTTLDLSGTEIRIHSKEDFFNDTSLKQCASQLIAPNLFMGVVYDTWYRYFIITGLASREIGEKIKYKIEVERKIERNKVEKYES